MKIINYIKQNEEPFLSIEIVPPKRGATLNDIFKTLDNLVKYEPKFINVTRHQSKIQFRKVNGNYKKMFVNYKPGTAAVCMAIQNRYNIDTVPHLICGGQNKYNIEDKLIEFSYLGFDNIFVVRGDPQNGKKFKKPKDGYENASNLIEQINKMNEGNYLYLDNGNPTDFCIGATGYPEKHYEAVNLKEDIQNLKIKVKRGAEYIITQMFFDFDKFKKFVNKVRDAGINIPIIPGLRPVIRKKTLEKLPGYFFINIPENFIDVMKSARSKKEEELHGTKYMNKLIRKLYEFGVPGIHIFTLGKGRSTRLLLDSLK